MMDRCAACPHPEHHYGRCGASWDPYNTCDCEETRPGYILAIRAQALDEVQDLIETVGEDRQPTPEQWQTVVQAAFPPPPMAGCGLPGGNTEETPKPSDDRILMALEADDWYTITGCRVREWWRKWRHPTPDERAWRDYHRECRRIRARNAGPGGYQGYPKPPGWTPPPIPAAWRSKQAP